MSTQTFYNAYGDELDEAEVGDVIYDSDGNEYEVVLEDEADDEVYDYEPEYAEVGKSLGQAVLEELSKAASEDEREYIIAKAMDEVEVAKAAASEAWQRVAKQEDAMLEQAFIAKAAEYNLPVDPVVLGPILKAASTVLSGPQLDLLDELFSGVGEVLYEEIGYVGDTDNASVIDVVNGYVGEYVGKSDASAEMITTAIFDSNPEAYDAYLAEQNGR